LNYSKSLQRLLRRPQYRLYDFNQGGNMRHRVLAGLAASVLIAAVPARAEEACQLIQLASFEIGVTDNGAVTVPAGIGNTPLTMLVDTGSYQSILTEGAAKSLRLQPKTSERGYLIAYGGAVLKKYVDATDFRIANMRAADASFMLMPDGRLGAGIDGLLGADLLYFFDLDFDFAKAKLNFFSPKHCAGNVVYWTRDAYAKIPFGLKARHIKIALKLDGKDVDALLDTGASVSVLSLKTANELFGIDEQTAKKNNYRYPFKTLSFEGVNVINPDIHLVPDEKFAVGEKALKMVLGMGVLRQLHLYIAYKEGNIYATPASAH
jgi:predicted aspartyl protease